MITCFDCILYRIKLKVHLYECIDFTTSWLHIFIYSHASRCHSTNKTTFRWVIVEDVFLAFAIYNFETKKNIFKLHYVFIEMY